ncbi:MAG TPA: CpsB/CapC family capsule biosynthesis tyrosine phosphatase [Longimicrobium sp.]|nr:CpsB/CapC family capsule biosynthesis tyrosine phosphatase [Longimicrobium sp.]
MIDFHNHLLAGVDDGAATVDETRAGMAAMVAQGVRCIVVTPHFSASTGARPDDVAAFLARLEPAWEQARAVAAEFPGLRLERGVEAALDTPGPDFADPRLRLAGTDYVLVEFPFMQIPPNGSGALFEMKVRGWRPIVAHPERYANTASDLSDVGEWRKMGALVQVNSGSLLGRYGDRAERLSWRLLRRGMVDFVCSDYHARGRPHVAEARAELERRGGATQARLLMEVNPARMLAGELPHPVAPLEEPAPMWSRVLGRLRGRRRP